MSLSDLASIGSFVSGVAVVVSFLFLTMQLRQNTQSLRRAEGNATQSQISAFRLAIANNRDVAKVWVTGLSDGGELDEIDSARFNTLMSETIWNYFHMWDRDQLGIWEAHEWKRLAPEVGQLLTTRRGANWWANGRLFCPPDYARAVDKTISDQMEISRRLS
jgi:hypothetical protein